MADIHSMDQWRLVKEAPAKEPWPVPYIKPKDAPSEPITIRASTALVEEARVFVEGKNIPGIDTLSKFMNMALHHTLEDIDKLEFSGKRGHFEIQRRNDALTQKSADRAATLESFATTIETLVKARDLDQLKDTLENLLYAQSQITNEPDDYCTSLKSYVLRVEGLINPE